MTDFLEANSPEEEAFVEPTAKPPKRSELSSAVFDNYAAVLNKTPTEVETEVQVVGSDMLKSDARTLAETNNQEAGRQQIQDLLTERPSIEEAQEQLSAARQNLTFGNYIAPDIAAMVSDKPMAAQEKRIYERVVAAERLVQEAREQRKEGAAASVGYFLDLAISDLVHSPINFFGGSRRELAEEASSLFFADLTEEEFNTQFGAILDKVADLGGFSDENPFYLNEFIEMVQENAAGTTSGFNQLFAAVDTASLVPVGRLASGGAKATNNLDVITKLGSEASATRVLTSKIDNAVDDVATLEGTMSSIETVGKVDDWHAGPNLKVAREAELRNTALQTIRDANFGDFIDPIKLEEEAERLTDILKEKNKAVKRHEMDYKIRLDATSNLIGEAYLGARGGKPYKTIEKAQEFADKIGGEVVETLHEGVTKYQVRKQYNLPTEGLVDPTDIKQVASTFFSRILSTTARTTPELDAKLKRGEAAGVRAAKIIGQAYTKARSKVSRTDRDRINDLFVELGNEPKWSLRKASPTAREFKAIYAAKYGDEAPEAVIDYYKSVRDITDLDYYLTADEFLKAAVNNKEDMMSLDGGWYRTRVVDNTRLDPDDLVFLADTGKMIKVSDLDLTKATIREVKDFAYQPEGVGMVQYVVSNSPITRRLYHTDVLAYRAGGSRKYAEPLEHFVKQEQAPIKTAAGKEVASKPVTFMGVRFSDEADKAVLEFNNIVKAVNTPGITTKELNEVILRNTSWNMNIEDIADFQEFARVQGLDITREVTKASDGQKLATDSPWAGEASHGDGFWGARARGDEKLVGYGGVELETVNPTTAIERDLTASISRKAQQRYLNAAIEGWVKAAEEYTNPVTKQVESHISYPAGFKGGNAYQKFINAVPDPVSEVGRKLQEEQHTIKYLMSNTTAAVAREQEKIRGISDWVYGKGWHKSAKAMSWMETGDPAGFLRAVAFHTKLGMFAVDQIYVQASQLINTLGITAATLGPVRAARAFAAVPVMRIALLDSIPEGAIKRIGQIQAPVTGISAEDFVLLRKWIKDTGRDVVERTVVEKNNPHSRLATNKFDRFIEAGQVPFNEGERIARVGAAVMNLAERRLKYPGEDIFADAVIDRMMHRQDILSASMTSASAAPWQRSLLAVPLQFTTYHVRIFEQLFTDRILSGKERFSLLFSHMMAYGAAAIPGAGYLQDKFGIDGVVDVNTEAYDVVRYGALDAILSSLSGADTALSTRLAVGEGLFDLYTSFRDQGLFETLSGPGGSIGVSVVGSFNKMMKNIFIEGSMDYVEADWNRFARNVTSYNRAYTYFMARRYGEMYSRNTLEPTLTKMTDPETMMASLGVPLAERDFAWTVTSNQFEEKRHLQTSIKEMLRMDRIARDAIKNDDWETANRIFEDIGAMIAVHRPDEQDTILFRLRESMTSHQFMTEALIKQGRIDVLQKLEGFSK